MSTLMALMQLRVEDVSTIGKDQKLMQSLLIIINPRQLHDKDSLPGRCFQ